MVEQMPKNDSNNLEDKVRTLQEENAKLLQLLRSRGCLVDSLVQPEKKSNESNSIPPPTNNSNVIQPINVLNFDSIQTIFTAPNNLLYLSQTNSSSSSPTTPTPTPINSNLNETEQHPISIRAKPLIPHSQTELPPKVKSESFDHLSRQISSSNVETSNLLDNDLNHKHPRPIRPKPSSRINSIQVFNSLTLNETKPMINNVLTPSALINNTNSSTVSILSPSTSFDDHPIDHSSQLNSTKSVDSSIKKGTKARSRVRKGTSTNPSPSNNATPVPIAPNLGRPLAPAPLNVQRIVTTKRSVSATSKKRPSKSIVSQSNDSSATTTTSSSADPFAESISGLMKHFDQELIASNFLSTSSNVPTTTNILSQETSSTATLIQTFDQIVTSTLTEYQQTTLITSNSEDFPVDQEQMTSLINEEDLRLVEMNFDENTFLKQFDFDDSTLKLTPSTEQTLFPSLLTTRTTSTNSNGTESSLASHSTYPGSSLINNNVFTTIVPLALQHSTETIRTNSRSLPEEGVQLTARHLEPSQVATYESGKYPDILDELVTVTDQDVLTHAQATATDPNVLPTDFPLNLFEETTEMIKTTDIEVAEETASAFVDLQYFYPIEEKDQLSTKQNDENNEEKEENPSKNDKFQLDLNSPKSDLENSITDLSSIIQIGQNSSTSSSSPPPPAAPSVHYEEVRSENPPTVPNRPARIVFEPILSPPMANSSDETIVDSGSFNPSSIDTSNRIDDFLNQNRIDSSSSSVPNSSNVSEENLPTNRNEQYSPIPSVKLKLHSILTKDDEDEEEDEGEDEEKTPVEPIRVPLKIKIRTNVTVPTANEGEETNSLPKLKIRKPTNKPKRRKSPTSSPLEQTTQPSIGQVYHPTSSSSHSHIPPTPGEYEDSMVQSSNNNADDQHPSHCESKSNVTSPISFTSNATKKYPYLFHCNDEPMTKTTFITPPPDNDHHEQKSSSDEHFQQSKKAKKDHFNSPASKPMHPQSQMILPGSVPTPSVPSPAPLPPPLPPAPAPHLDPYAQTYHQYNSNSSSTPFFHFPFSNPYINAHPSAPPTQYHPNPMKYPHPHPMHSYPPAHPHHHQAQQTPYAYHPHLQHQQAYHHHHHHHPTYHPNSNYMSSHDPHSYNR